MIERLALKIMIRVNDSVIHLMIELSNLFDVLNLAEDRFALITNGDHAESSKEKNIQQIKRQKTETVGPGDQTSSNHKERDTDFAIEIFLLIKIFSFTNWAIYKMRVNVIIRKFEWSHM